MHRPRLALGFLLAPILFTLVFFTFACGGGSERQVLDSFFRTAKLQDNATLANFATVAFNPKTDGIMDSYSVTTEGEEVLTPLELKALSKAYDDARKAEEEFTKQKLAFQDQHPDELKAYRAAETGSGPKPKGKISAEFQTAWVKWVDDTKVKAKNVSEAREKLSAARAIADVSVNNNAQNPVDPAQYDGELATKDITIAANIIQPDGQKVKKTLVVTMQQARLKADKPIVGKWIITNIKEAPGGKTS